MKYIFIKYNYEISELFCNTILVFKIKKDNIELYTSLLYETLKFHKFATLKKFNEKPFANQTQTEKKFITLGNKKWEIDDITQTNYISILRAYIIDILLTQYKILLNINYYKLIKIRGEPQSINSI